MFNGQPSTQRVIKNSLHCKLLPKRNPGQGGARRREKLEEREESEKETRKHSNIFGWKCSWPLFSPSFCTSLKCRAEGQERLWEFLNWTRGRDTQPFLRLFAEHCTPLSPIFVKRPRRKASEEARGRNCYKDKNFCYIKLNLRGELAKQAKCGHRLERWYPVLSFSQFLRAHSIHTGLECILAATRYCGASYLAFN